MSGTLEVHYVIISRRSAHKKDEVELLLQGRPHFQVIVDRRCAERRKNAVPIAARDNRRGKDRRF